MRASKCERCYRRDVCSLHSLAELTLPWVVEARRHSGPDWDRAHQIRRALRGSGHSPGFIEDWASAGALSQDDVVALVELVSCARVVTMAHLSYYCRQYQGPVLEDLGSDEQAA